MGIGLPLKLIYFQGCPNALVAEQRLEEAGIKFEKICQDSLPSDSPYRAYASPTLLINKTIIFGAATGVDGGCSLDLPDVEELKKRVSKAMGNRKPG